MATRNRITGQVLPHGCNIVHPAWCYSRILGDLKRVTANLAVNSRVFPCDPPVRNKDEKRRCFDWLEIFQ